MQYQVVNKNEAYWEAGIKSYIYIYVCDCVCMYLFFLQNKNTEIKVTKLLLWTIKLKEFISESYTIWILRTQEWKQLSLFS